MPTPEQSSLLPPLQASPSEAMLACALRPLDGHWDELRGTLSKPGEPSPYVAPAWHRFWAASGIAAPDELSAKAARVKRRVQEDGASYNVYQTSADGEGEHSASHVWPLELLPLLIDAPDWQRIEAGVRQRARLLNAALADLYGPRRLLSEGLLPAALVLKHPQFLRPLQGCKPLGGVHLHVVAFDLARGADGLWWIVAQRTQAPSGLGYMLENRLIVAEQFPQAFRELAVQRLAGAFRVLLQGLNRLAEPLVEAGQTPRIVLLTPGPANETYFEHAFLARYLGLALVEGGDLTVRERRVYLKTLQGLERVHGILRRVDDEYLDPLELRADSQLGVPGLVNAMRAGQVVVANAPGSGWLESPGLSAFWPGVAEALLGEELLLPASSGWWCGEVAAWARQREQLAQTVVAPTFPTSETTRGFQPFPAGELDEAALVMLRERIEADPAAHTLKARVRPSKQPVWTGSALEPRAAVLRVFALSDGAGGWTVLPGGLTRVASTRGAVGGAPDALLTMQAGCASVDTWVLTEGQSAVDRSSLLPSPLQAADLGRTRRMVTSRSAEHLFWLGRYTERAENTVRLARHALASLGASERSAHDASTGDMVALRTTLQRLAFMHGLLGDDSANAVAEPRRFAELLMRQLGNPQANSLMQSLRQLAHNAHALRERLSTAHWQLIQQLGQDFQARFPAALAGGEAELQALLATTDTRLAALTGGQLDRMTRDDGWRLLSAGRQIERQYFLADVLAEGLSAGLHDSDDGFALLLALFDSTITYRAQFQSRRELPALVQLLVMDADNPRSLAWVAHTLRERVRKLTRHDTAWGDAAIARLPNPDDWSLARLLPSDDNHQPLLDLLRECSGAALALSSAISQHVFAHVAMPERRVWL